MIGPDRRLCEDDSRLRLLKEKDKNERRESVVNIIIIYELFETDNDDGIRTITSSQ